MTVSLVVPVEDDGAERERNWSWLKQRYPIDEWQLVEAHDFRPAEHWSKGAQVNLAVRRHVLGDVLVIIDADLYVAETALREAVRQVELGVPWVMPHGVVYRMGKKASRALFNLVGDPPTPQPVVGRRHQGPVGGGIVVCRRAAFDTVHGIDPRFTGWGGEDISFGRALDTLVGSHIRLWAPVWHLWHTPLQRTPEGRASLENEQLAGRYLDATGDVRAMRALCEEH